MTEPGRVVLISGAPASGKSTVGELLARQFPRSAHLRGDSFRKMIVGGRVDMGPVPSPEALRQLQLRYRLATQAADGYADEGFTVVLQDVVIGAELTSLLRQIRTPDRYLIMLVPGAHVLGHREAERSKTGYHHFDPDDLDQAVRENTPGVGLWLDTGHQTPRASVAEILDRLPEARV